MNKEELRELVYINLGQASMCWSEWPTGVFQSTKAVELGKEIMEAIDEYVERDKVERKFKLDDSFKKRMEETVVSDTPASSWMDEYREEYDRLLASGMFWEFHPTWTGEWDKDKYAFCHDRKFSKK